MTRTIVCRSLSGNKEDGKPGIIQKAEVPLDDHVEDDLIQIRTPVPRIALLEADGPSFVGSLESL